MPSPADDEPGFRLRGYRDEPSFEADRERLLASVRRWDDIMGGMEFALNHDLEGESHPVAGDPTLRVYRSQGDTATPPLRILFRVLEDGDLISRIRADRRDQNGGGSL
jgi:hypothetical protein